MSSKPNFSEISKPPTRVQGRIGTLTAQQTEAFKTFKRRIAEAGEYTAPSGDKPSSHDDVTLLRFLRARKFEVEGAFKQFTSTEEWRRKNKVPELYDNMPVDEFVGSQSVYPNYTGRRTKNGQPLYVYRISALTKERINKYSAEADRLEPRMIALSEMMTAFTLPMATALPRPEPNVPIDSTVSIVDVANVSLTRFWQLKSHMQRASVMASAAYPETLGAIYIVGSPNFFSTIWAWINRWFDPGTVSKIFILSADEVKPTLMKYIDEENIPKRYGGTLNWDYGDPVSLDADSQQLLGIDHLPRGPVRFSVKDGFKLVGSGRTDPELEEAKRVQEHVKEEMEAHPVVTATVLAASTGQIVSEGAISNVANGVAEQPAPTSVQKEQAEEMPSEATSPASSEPAPAQTPASIPASAPAPSPSMPNTTEDSATPIKPVPVAVAETIGAADPPISNGAATKSAEGHEHSIADAAREHPEAPIKDLAAALQGTTL